MFEQDKNARDFSIVPVDNLFLRDYLPAAKGDYIKVYLWGLYQCQAPSADYGVAEMAKDLEMTIPQVESALRYWERRALVSLISQDPPVYRFYSPLQRMHTGQLSDTADSEYTLFAESVYAAFGDKRKVTPAEIARIWEWVQDIGLPPEVVLMLIHHCISLMRSHFSFKRAEAMAVLMKESKVLTVEDAENFLRSDLDIHKGAQDVLRQFGKRGRLPSEPELKLYRKWRAEWGFAPDAILSACQETAKGEPTFAYLDAILNGIRTRGEARTGAAVQKQLQQEQDENALAREVMETLGLKTALTTALNFYRQWRKNMPHDVILTAAQLCARRGDKTESMDQLLTAWHDKGLTDLASVQHYTDRLHRIDPSLRKVFEKLAYTGRITEDDRLLYEKWQSFGYDVDMMCAAASQSHGVQGNKLRYLDSVLTSWHDAGITSLGQVQAAKKTPPASKCRTVNAQQYTQRTYTKEQFSYALESVLEEARKKNG